MEDKEKFECADCGCFYWVKDRDEFECPNCKQLKETQQWYMDYEVIQASETILNFIDFRGICEDHNLTSGDITPSQTIELERIIQEFIKQNK